MKTNATIKRISILIIAAVLCLLTAGCFGETTDIKGTYTIDTIQLSPYIENTLIITNFENHRSRSFEFRLEESGRATVSYIYFTDTSGSGTYYANSGSSVTTYRTSGSKVILEGGLGIGTMDIEVHQGGWLILNYKIENQLVYTAKYRK